MSEIPSEGVTISFAKIPTDLNSLEHLVIRSNGQTIFSRRTCDLLSVTPERNASGVIHEQGALLGEAIGDLKTVYRRDPQTLHNVMNALQLALGQEDLPERHRDIIDTLVSTTSRILDPTPYDRTVRVY